MVKAAAERSTVPVLRWTLKSTETIDEAVPTATSICKRSANDSAIFGIFLSSNNLYGSLPAMEKMAAIGISLQFIAASGNRFQFVIPPELMYMTQLRGLWIQNSNVSGPLPPSLFLLPNLHQLHLSGNMLTGTLPSIATTLALKELDLASNRLHGTLPSDWVDNAHIRFLDLSANFFEGTIPPPNGDTANYHVESIDLRSNQFTGTIPAQLAFSFLKDLDLGLNQLTGSIPDTFSSCSSLENFVVDYNRLTGTLPSFRAATNLQQILMDGNDFIGTLPQDWTDSPQLKVLSVIGLRLAGALPVAPNWEQLRYLNVYASGLSAPQLPDYLAMQRAYGQRNAGMNLRCFPTVAARTAHAPLLGAAILDPIYFGSQGCTCVDGYQPQGVRHGLLICVPITKKNNLKLIVAPIVVLITLCGAVALMWMRKSLPRLTRHWNRNHGPPEVGKPVTLVLTDVEGSTELWEQNHQVMSAAISLHDRLMRALLSRYYGYEVTTEGDAFMLAFHTPADAVAFCLAAQQELLAADWPPELLNHLTSCMKTTHHDKITPQQAAVDFDAAELANILMFRGLRIRMGIATGLVDHTQMHELTKRVEYSGVVMDLAKAISETPHGGQIVMDADTCKGIMPHLRQIAAEVHRAPDREAIRWFIEHGTGSRLEDDLYTTEPLGVHPTGGSQKMRGASRGANSHVASRSNSVDAETGPLLRQRSGVNGGRPTQRRPCQPGSDASALSDDAIQFLDMGTHALQSTSEPHKLYQVLVPGLEERARILCASALTSVQQLVVGYFDAPATPLAVLSPSPQKGLAPRLPPVTLVHCVLEGYTEMREANAQVLELACTLYVDCVRQQLSSRGGYECSLHNSAFLMAFHNPIDALQFAILVQESMLDIPWEEGIRAMPVCKTVLGRESLPVFCGPRLKMCLWEGSPTGIVPCQLTGHASYQGPFVSRVAGMSHCAAHGGDIIAGWRVAESVLSTWMEGHLPAIPPPGCIANFTYRQSRTKAGSKSSGIGPSPSNSAPASRRTSVMMPDGHGRRSSTTWYTSSPTPYSAQGPPAALTSPTASEGGSGHNLAAVQTLASVDMLKAPVSGRISAKKLGTGRATADLILDVASMELHVTDRASPKAISLDINDVGATAARRSLGVASPSQQLTRGVSDSVVTGSGHSLTPLLGEQHESMNPSVQSVHGHSRLRNSSGSTTISLDQIEAYHASQLADSPHAKQTSPRELKSSFRLARRDQSDSLGPSQHVQYSAAQHGEASPRSTQESGQGAIPNAAKRKRPARSATAAALDMPLTSPSGSASTLPSTPVPGNDQRPRDGRNSGQPSAFAANPVFEAARVHGGQVLMPIVEGSSTLQDLPGDPPGQIPASGKTSSANSSQRVTDNGEGVAASSASGSVMSRPIHNTAVSDVQHMLQDPWRSVRHIEIHHLGQMQFQGSSELHTLVRICSSRIAERVFPPTPATKQVRIVKPGRGHLYTVKLEHVTTKGGVPRKPRNQRGD
ncbi:hypothetical protein WJX72_007771 [[Myrmecia] bisecta]|uniref:Guanylate cyclase domain-containing protein n=1 Tax=[Myrmecia] bisecta TaxID=41462 RepID=A0AAW1PB84_9CHLO